MATYGVSVKGRYVIATCVYCDGKEYWVRRRLHATVVACPTCHRWLNLPNQIERAREQLAEKKRGKRSQGRAGCLALCVFARGKVYLERRSSLTHGRSRAWRCLNGRRQLLKPRRLIKLVVHNQHLLADAACRARVPGHEGLN